MANISTIKVGDTSYGIIPASHASATTIYGKGDTSNYGHVKLSDSYKTSGGAASSGIGASSAAVYNAYNTLNSNRCCSTIAKTGTIVVTGVTYEQFTSTGSPIYLWKFNTSILFSYTCPSSYGGMQGTYILGGIKSSTAGSLTSIPSSRSFVAHGLSGGSGSVTSPITVSSASCTADGVMTIGFQGSANYGMANTFFYNGKKVTITAAS